MAVDDSYTQSLLHWEGDDGATTFVDEAGHTWIRSGSAPMTSKLSDEAARFGNTSLDVRLNSNEYLELDGGVTEELEFGGGDWAWETFVRFTEMSWWRQGFQMFRQANTDMIRMEVEEWADNEFYFVLRFYAGGYYSGYQYIAAEGSEPFPLNYNQWYHILLCRSGNTYRFFLNGQKVYENEFAAHTFTLEGGHYRMFQADKMFVDETRLSVGTPRHTSNFSPPTHPYGEEAPSGIEVPAADMTMSGFAPYRHNEVPAGSLEMLGIIPNFGPERSEVSLADLSMVGLPPGTFWSIPLDERLGAKTIFILTIEGDEEIPTVEIPMVNFQATMRDGTPSYLNCVIPNPLAHVDEIEARRGNDMVVRQGYLLSDGTRQLEEIARAAIQSYAIDRGAKSASLAITGYRTVSSSTQKFVAIEGVQSIALQHDGRRRAQGDVNMFLRCGDVAVIGGESFTVGIISYTVSPSSSEMTITEAS